MVHYGNYLGRRDTDTHKDNVEDKDMNVTVLPNQTLLDIAIQEYGDLAGVFILARDNDISPTEKLTPGMTVSVPDVVINREMQEYCKANNVSPATSETSDSEVRLKIFTEQFTEQFV